MTTPINNRIKGNLPYPPENATLIIYNFLCNENNGKPQEEGCVWDLHTDEIKIPMKNLNQSELFWDGTYTDGRTNHIEGTNIYWKIQDGMFVFGLEE